jgi:hypothetical protein
VPQIADSLLTFERVWRPLGLGYGGNCFRFDGSNLPMVDLWRLVVRSLRQCPIVGGRFHGGGRGGWGSGLQQRRRGLWN